MNKYIILATFSNISKEKLNNDKINQLLDNEQSNEIASFKTLKEAKQYFNRCNVSIIKNVVYIVSKYELIKVCNNNYEILLSKKTEL